MRTWMLPLALLALAAPAWAADADRFEGKITFNVKNERGAHTMDYYTRPGQVRMEIEGQRGKMVMITDDKKQARYMLIPARNMYMQLPMNPPAAAGSPAQGKGGARPVKTGKTDTVAGMKCEIWTTSDKASGRETELCLARGLGRFQLMRSPMQRPGDGEEHPWQDQIGDMFPLRAVTSAGGKEQNRMEVTKIEKKPQDASLFEVPAGYQQLPMGAIGGIGRPGGGPPQP